MLLACEPIVLESAFSSVAHVYPISLFPVTCTYPCFSFVDGLPLCWLLALTSPLRVASFVLLLSLLAHQSRGFLLASFAVSEGYWRGLGVKQPLPSCAEELDEVYHGGSLVMAVPNDVLACPTCCTPHFFFPSCDFVYKLDSLSLN